MQECYRVIRRLSEVALFAAVLGCSGRDAEPTDFEVTARYPHDPSAYTQGLLSAKGFLYESTGRYGHSELRRVELQTGRVLASRALPPDRFGEGLALIGDVLVQLTWKAGVAYRYDAETLTLRDSLHYPGEGWGLATDGEVLFLSDGSDSIRVLSPESFQVLRVVHVRLKGAPLYKLNELEFTDGALLANVYESNWVLRIDPETGNVLRLIDLSELFPDRPPSAEVMNGLAVAPDGVQLLVTGKFWPTVFQVRLTPVAAP